MAGKPGGVVRDWTKKTLVIDLENSLGKKFHFEIAPGEKDDLPTRPSSSPGQGITDRAVIANLVMSI